MNNPKHNWRLVSLGDVVRKVENNLVDPNESEFERFIKVEHLDADSLKIRRWGLLENEELPPTFRKIFKPGQVLYPTRNPHLRRAAYADFEGICGEKTLTLEPKDELASELFPFIFQREDLIQHTTSMMIGSTNPHIRWRDLASFKFELPPLDEQRRIAEILWAAEETYEKFQQSCSELIILKQSYIEKVFSTKNEIAYFRDFAEFITTGSRGWAEHYVESGAMFLRVTNLTKDKIELDLSDTKYVIPPATTERERTHVKPRDLLISASADLGRLAVVPDNFPEAYVNQHVAIVRLKKEVNPRYVANYLLSKNGQLQFRKYNEGATRASLNFRGIQSLQFPYIEEKQQELILQNIDGIDKNYFRIIKHLEKVKALKLQLLHDLLSARTHV